METPRPLSHLSRLALLALASLTAGQARAAGEGVTVSVSPASLVAEAGAPAALDVTPGCIPSWVVEGRTVRRLPDRCTASAAGATAAVTAQPATTTAAAEPATETPSPSSKATPRIAAKARVDCRQRRYWVDARGIRRLRPQCL